PAHPPEVVDGGGPALGERHTVVALQAPGDVAALDDALVVPRSQGRVLVAIDVAAAPADGLDVDAVGDDQAQVGIGLPLLDHRHRHRTQAGDLTHLTCLGVAPEHGRVVDQHPDLDRLLGVRPAAG